jgi:hypothetical protein
VILHTRKAEEDTFFRMAQPQESRDVARLGPSLYQGIDKTSLAFKMLQGMGWNEGQGLVSRSWMRRLDGTGACIDKKASRHRDNAEAHQSRPVRALPMRVCLCESYFFFPLRTTSSRSKGANNQGITEHLRVKKKFDTLGMGAVSAVLSIVGYS